MKYAFVAWVLGLALLSGLMIAPCSGNEFWVAGDDLQLVGPLDSFDGSFATHESHDTQETSFSVSLAPGGPADTVFHVALPSADLHVSDSAGTARTIEIHLDNAQGDLVILEHLTPTSSVIRVLREGVRIAGAHLSGNFAVRLVPSAGLDLTVDIGFLEVDGWAATSTLPIISLATNDSDFTLACTSWQQPLMQSLLLPFGSSIGLLTFIGSDTIATDVQVGDLPLALGHLDVRGSARDLFATLPSHATEHLLTVRSGLITHSSRAAGCVTAMSAGDIVVNTDICCTGATPLTLTTSGSITIVQDVLVTSDSGKIRLAATFVIITGTVTSSAGAIEVIATSGGPPDCGIHVQGTGIVFGSPAGVTISADCASTTQVVLSVFGTIQASAPDQSTVLHILARSTDISPPTAVFFAATSSLHLGRGTTNIEARGDVLLLGSMTNVVQPESPEVGQLTLLVTDGAVNIGLTATVSLGLTDISVFSSSLVVQETPLVMSRTFMFTCLSADALSTVIGVSATEFSTMGVCNIDLDGIFANSITSTHQGTITLGNIVALGSLGTINITGGSAGHTSPAVILLADENVTAGQSISLVGTSSSDQGVFLRSTLRAPVISVVGTSLSNIGVQLIDNVFLDFSISATISGTSTSTHGILLFGFDVTLRDSEGEPGDRTLTLSGTSAGATAVALDGFTMLAFVMNMHVVITAECSSLPSGHCLRMNDVELGTFARPIGSLNVTSTSDVNAMQIISTIVVTEQDIRLTGMASVSTTSSGTSGTAMFFESSMQSVELDAGGDIFITGIMTSLRSIDDLPPNYSLAGVVLGSDADLGVHSFSADGSIHVHGEFIGETLEGFGVAVFGRTDWSVIDNNNVTLTGIGDVSNSTAFGMIVTGSMQMGDSSFLNFVGKSPTFGFGILFGTEGDDTTIDAIESQVVINGSGHDACRNQCTGVLMLDSTTIEHSGLIVRGEGGTPNPFVVTPVVMIGVAMENPTLSSDSVAVTGIGGPSSDSPGIVVSAPLFTSPGSYRFFGTGTGAIGGRRSHGILFQVDRFEADGEFEGIAGLGSVGVLILPFDAVAGDVELAPSTSAELRGTSSTEVGLVILADVALTVSSTVRLEGLATGDVQGNSFGLVLSCPMVETLGALVIDGTNADESSMSGAVLIQTDVFAVRGPLELYGSCAGGFGIGIATETPYDTEALMIVEAETIISGSSFDHVNATDPSPALFLPAVQATAPLTLSGTSVDLADGIRVASLETSVSFVATDRIRIDSLEATGGILSLRSGGVISNGEDTEVGVQQLLLPMGLTFEGLPANIALSASDLVIGGAFVSDVTTVQLRSNAAITVVSDLTLSIDISFDGLLVGGDVSIFAEDSPRLRFDDVSIDGDLTFAGSVEDVALFGELRSDSMQFAGSGSISFAREPSLIATSGIVVDMVMTGFPTSLSFTAPDISFSSVEHTITTPTDGPILVSGATTFQARMSNASVRFVDSVNFVTLSTAPFRPAVKDLVLDSVEASINGLASGCVEAASVTVTNSDLRFSFSSDAAECVGYDAILIAGDGDLSVMLDNANFIVDRQNLPLAASVYPIIGAADVDGSFVGMSDASLVDLPLGSAVIFYDSTRGAESVVELAPISPPRASADVYNFLDSQPFSVPADEGVLLNDNAAPVAGNSLTAVLLTTPPGVTVNLDPSGSFSFSFSGSPATFTFQYEAVDAFAETSLPTNVLVNIIVTPPSPSSTASPSPSTPATPSPSPVLASSSATRTVSPSRVPATGASIGALPSPSRSRSRIVEAAPSAAPSRSVFPSQSPLVPDPCLNPGQVLCNAEDEVLVLVTGVPEVTFAPPNPAVIREVPEEELASAIVDITPGGGYEEGEEVEICFRIDRDLNSDSCLGFIDETLDPPEWRCEDPCLEVDGNQACGTTNHFTNFAILLDGGRGGGGGCGSSDDDYIFAKWWQDLILVFSVVLLVLVICFILCVALLTPPGQKLLMGKEGTRVRSLRSMKVGGDVSTV